MSRGTQDEMQRVIDFEYEAITFFGVTFQSLLLSITFVTLNALSYNPNLFNWFGLFPVRSPLLRESLFVFFSSGY